MRKVRRRVLQGETLSNEEKIFSIFEPHTERSSVVSSRTRFSLAIVCC